MKSDIDIISELFDMHKKLRKEFHDYKIQSIEKDLMLMEKIVELNNRIPTANLLRNVISKAQYGICRAVR